MTDDATQARLGAATGDGGGAAAGAEGGVGAAGGNESVSVAEFFSKNKQMLGFDSRSRALVTAVKEAVDNSLDACEEAGVLPEVHVTIERTDDNIRLVVADNGPGVTRDQVARVFGSLLYGSRFHRREQHRGQQGIGISAAVLYGQMTTGRPARVTTRTPGGTARQLDLVIDTDENEPEVRSEAALDGVPAVLPGDHGTAVDIEMDATLRGRQKLRQYVERSAVTNPHARIVLNEPKTDGVEVFERSVDDLPPETEAIDPHPHGVDLGEVIEMLGDTTARTLRGFLTDSFVRVGAKTAEAIADEFRDRHLGRELAWDVPGDAGPAVAEAVRAATNNKPADATGAFAAGVADRLAGTAVTRTDVEAAVAAAAEDAREGIATQFGTTVREKAADAAWGVVTRGDTRRATMRAVVGGATTDRKDQAVVAAVADRLAAALPERAGDRHRLTRAALREAVDAAADHATEETGAAFGDTAREKVTDAVWGRAATVGDDPPAPRALAGDRDAAAALVAAMDAADVIAPPDTCLSPVGEEALRAGLREARPGADFYAAATRDAAVNEGDPFVAEAAIAHGPSLGNEDDPGELLRFANRVPLVYQQGACAITDVVADIGWRNYQLGDPSSATLPVGPVVIAVHVASTNVPFTSESKDALANVPAIEEEVERAVREAARELKRHLRDRRRQEKRRRKRAQLGGIFEDMGERVAAALDRDPPDTAAAAARAVGDLYVGRAGDGATTLRVCDHRDRGDPPTVVVEGADTGGGRRLAVDSADGEAATAVEDGIRHIYWTPDPEAAAAATGPGGGDATATPAGGPGGATLEYRGVASEVRVEGVPEEEVTLDA